MGKAEECFKKAHVKLKYEPRLIPTTGIYPMQDCKKVFVNVSPHVTVTEGWPWTFDVDLLCSGLSLEGVGGTLLALQVTTYIRWHMWFHGRVGFHPRDVKVFDGSDVKVVHEWHQVLVSLPMLYKLQGPRMLLMAVSPWPIKLILYGRQVAFAFKKLEEVNKVLGLIKPSGQISWCFDDVRAFEKRLQQLETELNGALEWMLRSSDYENLAATMNYQPFGSGRFAGARFA